MYLFLHRIVKPNTVFRRITLQPQLFAAVRRTVVHFLQMMSPVQQLSSICPYCAQAVTACSGRSDCPHCQHVIFNVPCPKCGRPTLNLTLIARYGKVSCFACQGEYTRLPDDKQEQLPPPPAAADPTVPSPRIEEPAHPSVMPRTPKHPSLPTAAEARAVVEQCLLGLERAAQDRTVLRAPDLRIVITRFLDVIQETLELDAAMERGDVTPAWLADEAHLAAVVRLCYTPLWPGEAALLPAAVQAWTLVVDDAARRWQYARRGWLVERCGLEMMPTVPGVTTVNPVWHEIIGTAPVISEVLSPGFLLGGAVQRRARVLAEG